MKQLCDILTIGRSLSKNGVAIIDQEGIEYTYADLISDASRISHENAYMSDRIVFTIENTYHSIASLFGVMMGGEIPAIVGPNTPLDKLDMIREEFSQLDNPLAHDTAMVLYTSGSSGRPKGVMCTAESMFAAIDSINRYLVITKKDRTGVVLPLSHGYGLYQVLCTLCAGGTVVLLPEIMKMRQFLNAITEQKITGLAVVPTMLSMLFKTDSWSEKLASLRYLTNAGDALPSAYYNKLVDKLPTTEIIPMHGLTECVRTMWFPPFCRELFTDTNILPTGVPIPGVTLQICDEEGNPVKEGEVGELYVAGPNVMSGYYNRPNETADTFQITPNGFVWLATGDLFYQKGNFYYYASRKDDMVKIKGEKVYPKEVESSLYMLEGVEQVAVTTKTDDKQGCKLVAHVAGDVKPIDVKRYVKNNLGPMYVPDVVMHDELPKNSNGKLDRKALRN